MESLFQECVDVLQAHALDIPEEHKIQNLYHRLYPTNQSGKIDWDKIPNNQRIFVGNKNPQDILPSLCTLLGDVFDTSVYIEWDSFVPMIRTNIQKVVDHFWDMNCVSPNKVMFNLKEGYIVEIRSWGDINVGVVPVPEELKKML